MPRQYPENCPKCDSPIAIIGNGPYAAPRCTGRYCHWFARRD